MERGPGRVRETSHKPRPSLGAWLFVCALCVLCGVLGILQYRAITEVSIAARERLHSSLQASLVALSQDFNTELRSAVDALAPNSSPSAQAAQDAVAAAYESAPPSSRRHLWFSRIAMAVPQKGGVDLRLFDRDARVWIPAGWPAEWSGMRRRFEFSGSRGGPGGGRGPQEPSSPDAGPAFETPIFSSSPGGFSRGGREASRPPSGPSQGRHEVAWLILELDVPYLRQNVLPEILERHLGADYQAELIARAEPPQVVYRSDPGAAPVLPRNADASVSLFDPQMAPFRRGPPEPWRRGGPPNGGPAGRSGGRSGVPDELRTGLPSGPGNGPLPDSGRWVLFVRHRAGSLEAVVAQARWRSMAVTAGVLLLLAATLAALVRYTRRAQTLAALQMEFVAGVSHELRTPLTVIHTAAYNLRGKLAANPVQVERYGALIQSESGRLKDLVEQVLRFAGANAGHVLQEREPLAVEAVLDEAVAFSKPLLENAGCVVEKRVDAALPAVLGDRLALRQAIENLLSNAAKYGSGERRWIGIAASAAGGADQPAIEVRISDRGPGIPPNEQKHIFDPFFRGSRAVQDQVHGTGLGLSLVKKIVEAHGGTVRVKSEPGEGAKFIVRLPAMAAAPSADRVLSSADPPGGAR